MVKVVAIVIAVLLFLGAGIYMINSKSNKSSVSPQTANNQVVPLPTSELPTGNVIPPTLAPVAVIPTVDAKKNQITLKITTPANNATLSNPSVTVKGITSPGAEVSVNEQDVTAGADGSFAATLTLDEGDNYVSVVAIDADGKAAEVEMNLTLTTGN